MVRTEQRLEVQIGRGQTVPHLNAGGAWTNSRLTQSAPSEHLYVNKFAFSVMPASAQIVESASRPSETAFTPFLEVSSEALRERDVRCGYVLMEEWFGHVVTTNAAPLVPPSVLLAIAQWVDLGYENVSFLELFLSKYDRHLMAGLPVLDFLRLTLVHAYLDLARERTESAAETIDLVLRIHQDLLNDDLLFVCHFWKGRAHRKHGEYERAAVHIAAAKSAAERTHSPKLAAVTKIHESWLAFQDGRRGYAFELLEEAETVLRPTAHALSLGNIESARGRFVRRSGDYAEALQHFENAIAIYRDGCPDHPNLARALVNAAYVKRLIALDLQDGATKGDRRGTAHAKALETANEALALLRSAAVIYAQHDHAGGTGSVLVNSAQIHLEIGDIAQAALEGKDAFALGEAKHDQILMARARNVQSAVSLAYAEEQIGERPNTAFHAHCAVHQAEAAIELALQTQNRRLLCEAYIARSMAAASDYFRDWDNAKTFATKAAEVLNHEDRDHLYKQMAALKARLASTTQIDERLRLWCDGIVKDQTFRQIQEEFAQIVIPQVWLRHGQNVSMVSKTLSISPKKVRRVLRSASQRTAFLHDDRL